jgi:hypothetical protein
VLHCCQCGAAAVHSPKLNSLHSPKLNWCTAPSSIHTQSPSGKLLFVGVLLLVLALVCCTAAGMMQLPYTAPSSILQHTHTPGHHLASCPKRSPMCQSTACLGHLHQPSRASTASMGKEGTMLVGGCCNGMQQHGHTAADAVAPGEVVS